MTPENILKELEIPEENGPISIKDSEALFIYNFLKSNKINKTLETGFAFGKSTALILSATRSAHIAIDPFQEDYEYIGLKNIKNLELRNNFTHINDYSHNALPELVKENKEFEFIFIDGDHKFDGIFIDFYYSDLLLKEDGYILLHDTWLRSTSLLMKFIKNNRIEYTKIKTPNRNLALYKKTGHDTRDGMHFKEFYTFKSILSFRIISMINRGYFPKIHKVLKKLRR